MTHVERLGNGFGLGSGQEARRVARFVASWEDTSGIPGSEELGIRVAKNKFNVSRFGVRLEVADLNAVEVEVDTAGKDKLVIQAELDEAKDANTAALRNHVVAKNAFADDASDANQVALDAALAALQTASEVLVSATHAEKCKVHFDAIDAEASAAAGGDLPIIPIAAGAGGVVVILIIVIVVMASKGGNQQAGPKGTSVVAFENPMYDDPSQGNKGNPMYDETGGDGGDEGLYDEPAFNGEADNGGGYLDVEPDDDDDDDEDEDDEFSEEAEESESEDE